MKVEDIGVLQNLINFKHLNGLTAEIIGFLEKNKRPCAFAEIPEEDGYRVICCEGSDLMIDYSKIRPISDPDQHQTKETEKEIVG